MRVPEFWAVMALGYRITCYLTAFVAAVRDRDYARACFLLLLADLVQVEFHDRRGGR